MEPFQRSQPPGPDPDRAVSRRRSRAKQPARTPFSYRACDGLTEGLLYFMVVFTPWAFGTVEPWGIWTMNICAYALGLLLAGKWIIRWQTGYQPARWTDPVSRAESEPVRVEPTSERALGGPPRGPGRPGLSLVPTAGSAAEAEPASEMAAPGIEVVDPDRATEETRTRWLVRCLALLTGLILAYILIGALNARATYLPGQRLFEYHDCIDWLPHSYDSTRTWRVFWQYLGLAAVFWAARDWLLAKTRRERHRLASRERTGAEKPALLGQLPSPSGSPEVTPARHELPGRLRRLLWVVCLNGALLGLEAILQRVSGTNKLLWLLVPWLNQTVESQFGPYPYRANAAAYLNLVWPVCLSFWYVLRRTERERRHRHSRVGSSKEIILLPGAVLMAAGPIISTTRGGALISMGLLLCAVPVLLFASRRETWHVRVGILWLFLVIVGLAGFLGWKELAKRFESVFTDQLSRRVEIYETSRPIAEEFRLLGSGPGTFSSLYQLYRQPQQTWAGYLHDDWLETRITFGWLGFSLILAAFGLILARWFQPGGIPASKSFIMLLWLALAGCLLHAKFDFPFQIYSILFLFVLLSSISFCLSRSR